MAFQILSILVVTLAAVIAVQGASIATGRLQQYPGPQPRYPEQHPGQHPGQYPGTGQYPGVQQFPGVDRPECPAAETIQCAPRRPCGHDYDCLIPPFGSVPSDQSTFVDKCCPTTWTKECYGARFVCTKVPTPFPGFPIKYLQHLPCPYEPQECGIPRFCSSDEECSAVPGSICCRSECNEGVCTSLVPLPVNKMSNKKPTSNRAKMTNTKPNVTSLLARLQAALARRQNADQCPLEVQSKLCNRFDQLRCRRNSQCDSGVCCSCPESEGVCLPKLETTISAKENKKEECSEHDNGGTKPKVPPETTTIPPPASPTPSFEEALMKLLAKKLEN